MKERLDVLLVKEIWRSQGKGKSDHYVRKCFVEGQREDKAGSTFPEEVSIEVRGIHFRM